jgi:O-antigen/teichoic acid export membrane protein
MSVINQALKSRYIRDNFIFLIGTLLGGFLGYLFHFFVARKLTVGQYGEMQSVFALVAIAGIFTSGFSYFVIKYSSLFAARNAYKANSQFISYLNRKLFGIVAVVSLLLIASIPFVKKILHLSDIWGIVAGILAVIFSAAAVVYQETLRAWQKFFSLTIAGLAAAFSKLIFGYSFASFFKKSSPVVWALAISIAFGWLAAICFWKRAKEKSRDGAGGDWEKYISRKKIWKNAAWIFFFSLVIALVMNIDILLVKILTTPEFTGYYGALSVLGKIVLWLNFSVVSVALPRACADGHRGERLDSKIFLFSLGLMLAIGAGLILIYYNLAPMLVVFLFGEKYRAASGFLWVFGLMSLLLSLLKFEADLAFAKHDFRVSWLLLLTVFVMAAAIFRFHGTLAQVAVSVIFSLLLGYFFAVLLNFSSRKKKIVEPII